MPEIALKHGKVLRFDEEDRYLIEQYTWVARKSKYKSRDLWYAVAHPPGGGKYADPVLLHRLLTNCPEDKQVDHWDGDGLNNKRKNLRVCNNAQNGANKSAPRDSIGMRCIYKLGERWRVYMGGRKPAHVGMFDTVVEARIAYNTEALKLYGEFARLYE